MSEEKQVPIYERLESVPEDIRIGIDTPNPLGYDTEWVAVGVICKEAASELRRLYAEVEKLHKIAEYVACRSDGRCQYAIDHGAEGLGHCPDGKCCMPQSAATVYIQRDHLQKAQKAPFLCRVEPTQRLSDFVPLYTRQLIQTDTKN